MSEKFNAKEHLITIKSKQGASDYLPVKYRLVWFRDDCPNGVIETEMIHLDMEKEFSSENFVWNAEKRRSEKVVKTEPGVAIFRAIVKDGKGGVATATKMETAASFPDYLEKAETGAIGRALAALGYGTQFTGDEMDESKRIVDSPVERPQQPQQAQRPNQHQQQVQPAQSVDEPQDAAITEQQMASIRKMSNMLDKPEPENLANISFLAAKRLIQQLNAEYREAKQRAS